MDCISLIIHGGAGASRSETTAERRLALNRALDRGWALLQNGGSSLDACEQAIIELENSGVFDAGLGSYLNRDGHAQLDAILMDGATLAAGAVAAVERIRNPIQVARILLKGKEHILLVGPGAERFAAGHGVTLCEPADLISPVELERWKARTHVSTSSGTVGAVARDKAGNIASGTSTGGTFFKHPGRVGDSPLIGCGCYADNLSAAVSCTGHGESIMKVVLAKTAADFVAGGHAPQTAADSAIGTLARRTSGQGGLIVVDRHGGCGVSFSAPHMSYAIRSSDGTERIVA